MTLLQMRSARPPFGSLEVAGEAARLLALAEASGVWSPKAAVDTLDQPVFEEALTAMSEAGVARQALMEWRAYAEKDPESFAAWIRGVRDYLAQSPVPDRELPRLEGLFGAERLANLIGVAHSSLRRYLSTERDVPDVVALRGHVLAQIVGDLAGSYNERGVRRWFERQRSQLDGRAPAEILADSWDPEGPDVSRVLALAAQRSG